MKQISTITLFTLLLTVSALAAHRESPFYKAELTYEHGITPFLGAEREHETFAMSLYWPLYSQLNLVVELAAEQWSLREVDFHWQTDTDFVPGIGADAAMEFPWRFGVIRGLGVSGQLGVRYVNHTATVMDNAYDRDSGNVQLQLLQTRAQIGGHVDLGALVLHTGLYRYWFQGRRLDHGVREEVTSDEEPLYYGLRLETRVPQEFATDTRVGIGSWFTSDLDPESLTFMVSIRKGWK